jgi:nitroimidazol reductase NimA-like FMN-containing flavoprotein (pyridoxamine 5'-phosphate oxidase superfamily)
MDTDHELRTGDLACDYSMNFASVVGSGHLSKVTDDGERLRGLNAVMAHYGGEGRAFNEAYLPVTCVLKLDVAEYICKRLKK